MILSTLLLSALALLPSPAAAAPAITDSSLDIRHSLPTIAPSWTLDRRASDDSTNFTVFYPNITKVYDLFSYGTNFSQFCLKVGAVFINSIDQRSMLHRFDFSEELANRTCQLDFMLYDFNLYYNSSFPIKIQLFTTMPGTPLDCDNNQLNDQRDRHIADIVILSTAGNLEIVKYSDDFFLNGSDCPTTGTQGYELVITGENNYATWGLQKNGLIMQVLE